MTTPLVNASKHEGVMVLELRNPPANTYSYEMMRELDAHILDARMDESIHVLVITGAPPPPDAKKSNEFFCAGADIEMLRHSAPYFKYNFCLHANETLCRLEQTPKLVIAAINGHCVGGGLEIALACDLRVARVNAGKIGLPEVSLGVLPGTGGTQRLARALGRAKAIELMAEAATFAIDEGKSLGLINSIIDAPAGEFRARALEYARKFVPPAKASRAVGSSSARSPLDSKSASSRVSPWSVSCSSGCSRDRTRRKAFPRTTPGDRPSSAESSAPARSARKRH